MKLLCAMNISENTNFNNESALHNPAAAGAFMHQLVNLLIEHTPQDALEHAISSDIRQIASSEDESASDEVTELISAVCGYIETDTDNKLDAVIKEDHDIEYSRGAIGELLHVMAGISARVGKQVGEEHITQTQDQTREDTK